MFLRKKTITIKETDLFSKLICDFIDNDEKLKPFLGDFPTLKSVKSSIGNINNHCRVDLVETLREQYNQTSFSNVKLSAVESNINKLLDLNAYTITTGHQIHLLASPLFLIYKIISTIAYANYLNEKIPKHHCVPCFWMATEDHDFDEINSFELYNETYSWNVESSGPVGDFSTKSIIPILNSIESVLKQSSFGSELYSIYSHAYMKNEKYADAIRSLLSSFFGEFGLVVIDPNHRRLKKLFVNEFKDEINNNLVFTQILNTNKKMSENYKPQINALHSNIFYLSKSVRSKIEFDGDKYFSKIHNKIWNKSDLLSEIDDFPENFSPNVFLRTLYQQRIMPNALYLGGANEIAYWLQLKDLFEKMSINYPVLQLRSFFLILSRKQFLFQEKYNFSIADIFLETELKINKILKADSNMELNALSLEMDTFLNSVKNKIKLIDGFNFSSFNVFEKRLKKELIRLESKVIKSNKVKNKNLITQIRSIDHKLFPNNTPQERISSFIPFYMKYGKSFFKLLIKESSIFDNKYIILTEDS